MTLIDVFAMPAEDNVQSAKYDYNRLPEHLRIQAMTAEGTVVQGLQSAIQRVVEAGQVLMWAKETLPHGEYLPWVQQACELKPQYAQKLIKAAEWANAAHERHLDSVTDANTLFLLSADTTPEEVREWFMERCAAGVVPSRKEVQERKKNHSEPARQRTVLQEALSALKLSPEARSLALQAEHISTRQLMDELHVDELPKGTKHFTEHATYCKNGVGWWKLPFIKPIDVSSQSLRESPISDQQAANCFTSEVMPIQKAASFLGISQGSLSVRLTPKQVAQKGVYIRNGYQVTRDVPGIVRLTPINN